MTITERHLNTIAVALEQLPQLGVKVRAHEDASEWRHADDVYDLIEAHRYDSLLALARLVSGHFNVVPQEQLTALATNILAAIGEDQG